MQTNNSHFDSSAAAWDTPDKVEGAKKNAGFIKQALTTIDSTFHISSILEVGCGTGLLGEQFLDHKTAYAGIDDSVEMLKVLKNKLPAPHIQTFKMNIETDPLPSVQYNLVISQMAFHHLKSPASVLKKLHSKPGVMTAIIDLDKEDGSFHPDPKSMGVHHFGFSKSDLESLATEAGLNLRHYEIIEKKVKNGKVYPLFLAIFSKSP